VNVLRVAALDGLFAGPLPAPGGQGDAEGAGIAGWHPGKFRPVPEGVAQGGVRPGLLHQPPHGGAHLLRVL